MKEGVPRLLEKRECLCKSRCLPSIDNCVPYWYVHCMALSSHISTSVIRGAGNACPVTVFRDSCEHWESVFMLKFHGISAKNKMGRNDLVA